MTNDLRNRLNKIIDDHNLNIGHAQPYDLKDQSYFRVIDAILAKLDTDALARPVRVKPLVWEGDAMGDFVADSVLGEFCVYLCISHGWLVHLDGHDDTWVKYPSEDDGFGTPDAAKAAAQAYYEASIRAALEPAEAHDPDALIVAALEAAAVFIKDNGSVMFTGRASDFVQTRTRTQEELMDMIRAHAKNPEARAAIKEKAGWSE